MYVAGEINPEALEDPGDRARAAREAEARAAAEAKAEIEIGGE